MNMLPGRITLAKISDGAPGPAGPSGQGFYIKANIEDLICYKNDRDITSITSSELVISVYKSQKYLEGEQIDLNVDNCDFGYDTIQGFVSLLEEEQHYSFYKEPVWENNEIDEEKTSKRPNSLKIDLNDYIKKDIFANLIGTPLKFKYYEDQNGPAAEKAFSFRWGTTADLASFDVTAFAITQAIGHNVMSFTQEGLQIYNTGLTIYGNETINYIQTSDETPQDKKKYYIKNNNNVYSEFIGESFDANEVYFEQIITQPRTLYADKEGNLHIYGCLESATGSFSGEVSATSGRIGGLELGENELRSGMYVNAEWDDREPRYKQEENGEYVKLTEKPDNDNVKIYKKALVISGNDGKIYANNIVLGDGAIIENFIALGTEENEKAFLQNPDKYDKVFLKSGDISFSSNGTAKFGSISLEKNGQDMEIKGTNWSILPDRASFKNISVSGDIETAVFKTDTVQAGGSTMLFMPSYSVLDWDKVNNKIVIDGKYSMKNKETSESTAPESTTTEPIWLVFDNSYSKNTIVSTSFDENNKQTTVTLGETISNKPIGMIIIGTNDNLVMGINGSNTNALDGLILARGLTLTSVTKKEKDSKPNLFLGDLTSVGLSGYGLYSDNVHLNGSLVTRNGAYYAGINTTDPWYIGEKEEKNRAIFWAGVTKNENSGEYNYSDSPFYVTQGGHVYAKDIELAEAVIAGGSITGTEIHTAKIYGEGSANNSGVPGLSIYDTNNGISFRTIKEQDGKEIEIETFSIGLSGLKVENSEFVLIENDEVVFTGAQFKTDNSENYLSIGKINNIPALYHKEGTSSCGFYFEKSSTNFKIEENVKLKLASGGIELDGSVAFSQYQKGKLTYQAAEKGYDLFVE